MKWIGAIPVLKVLVFAGLFNTLPVAMWSLFKSTGHPKAEFWFSVIQVSLFFLLIAPLGKLYGLIGVGIVVALASLVANIALLPFTKRLIQLKIKDIYLCIRPSLMSSLLMGLGIILLKYALPKCNTGFIFYYNSTTEVIFAGATYCLLLLKIEKNIFKEIKEMVLR
jgi:O-antigen/teichoic acid export membrane protein